MNIDGRYVIEYEDVYSLSGGAMKRAIIYGPIPDGWPRRRAKGVGLIAETEEKLEEAISLWRKLGKPNTQDELGAAIDRHNEALAGAIR